MTKLTHYKWWLEYNTATPLKNVTYLFITYKDGCTLLDSACSELGVIKLSHTHPVYFFDNYPVCGFRVKLKSHDENDSI
jgi:hypothetical protein